MRGLFKRETTIEYIKRKYPELSDAETSQALEIYNSLIKRTNEKTYNNMVTLNPKRIYPEFIDNAVRNITIPKVKPSQTAENSTAGIFEGAVTQPRPNLSKLFLTAKEGKQEELDTLLMNRANNSFYLPSN